MRGRVQGHQAAQGMPTHSQAIFGDQQTGRLEQANDEKRTVIWITDQCEAEKTAAIEKATSEEHRAFARTAPNPYGDGHAAERMAELLADRALIARAREAGFGDLDCNDPRDRGETR